MFLFVPPTKAYTVTYNPEPLNLKNSEIKGGSRSVYLVISCYVWSSLLKHMVHDFKQLPSYRFLGYIGTRWNVDTFF